jgi:hypothetical protein
MLPMVTLNYRFCPISDHRLPHRSPERQVPALAATSRMARAAAAKKESVPGLLIPDPACGAGRPDGIIDHRSAELAWLRPDGAEHWVAVHPQGCCTGIRRCALARGERE